MGGFMRGKFQATGDLDLAFNRIRNWRDIADLPTVDAEEGQVIALVDGVAAWTTVSEGGSTVAWDDITGKPSSFTPEAHTHTESEITDLQNYALDGHVHTAADVTDFDTEVGNNAVVVSNTEHRTATDNPHSVTTTQIGAATLAHTHVVGDITGLDTGVTTLTAGAGINLSSSTDSVTITNSGVLSIVAGTNISVNTSVGTVTISASGTGGGGGVTDITAGAGISVNTSTGSVTISAVGSNELGYIDVTAATYGAVGDGSTDDTSAIQSAVDAADGGYTVYLPPGDYKVSTIALTASHTHITIRGAGRGASRLVQNTTSTSPLISFTGGADDNSICDLKLEGGGNTDAQSLIYFFEVDQPRMRACEVFKVGTTTAVEAVEFRDVDGGGVHDSYVHHDDSTRTHLYRGLQLRSVGSSAVSYTKAVMLSNNYMQDCVTAINIGASVQKAAAVGNFAENCTQTVRDIGTGSHNVANYP
jgi:hypothetical protein